MKLWCEKTMLGRMIFGRAGGSLFLSEAVGRQIMYVVMSDVVVVVVGGGEQHLYMDGVPQSQCTGMV